MNKADPAYRRLVRNLALATERWARAKGAYRDPESKQILGVFTVYPTRSKQRKPCWSKHPQFREYLKEYPHIWRDVRNRLIATGVPLTFAITQGWFIGSPGEHGRYVASGVNATMTRLKTTNEIADYLIMSNQPDRWGSYFKDSLSDELRKAGVSLYAFRDSYKGMILALGMPFQESAASYMLDNGEDENGVA